MQKKTLLFLLAGCFIFSGVAFAHPPKDIIMNFDPGTKVLTAAVMHDTKEPLKHYIKRVDVGLNGKNVIKQNLSKQDNQTAQTVAYLIPEAKKGDKISVEAYCSQGGDLEREITVK
jgi:hypothetical protein